jgi:phenylacetic acid degradation operon negative regulatory protein
MLGSCKISRRYTPRPPWCQGSEARQALFDPAATTILAGAQAGGYMADATPTAHDDGALGGLLEAFPVSAGAFVVTLYGDVVAPRGGEVWTGNVVETCAAVGIAETRVRTAVSRLVAAGRIEGTKLGRRSYYRLTPEAEREFAQAARLIYAPVRPPPMRGWHLVALPAALDRDAAAARLARLRFGFPQPGLALLPNRGEPLPSLPGCRFAATTHDHLGDLVGDAWPLEALAARMRRFVDGFARLGGRRLAPAEAVGLRLLLVHGFREIALSDPLLPPELLPAGWPGPDARALFARLYLALSPAADAAIAAAFVDRSGPLAPDPARLARRIADLSA